MTTLSSATAALAQTTPTTLPASGSDSAKSDRAKLHQAAQAFEAIFVREMLSAARATTFGDDLWGNDQGNATFAAMRDERFADIAAQSGTLGLGRQVERQLSPLIAAPPAVGRTG